MGSCLSKPRKKDYKEGRKERTRNKNKQRFDGVENDRSCNAKKTAGNGKKSRLKRNSLSSDESSDSSSSEHGQRKPNVSSSKITKKGKDGGITTISNKTVILGKQYTIGEGATNVNVSIGGRNKRESGNRRDKPKWSETSDHNPSKPDFSRLKPRSEDEAFQMPACFLQLTDRSKDVAGLEVLVKAAKSVGKIHASDGFCATVFRVGPNYVMTCKHVLDGILNNESSNLADFARREGSSKYDVLGKSSVYVDFNYNHSNDQPNHADVGTSKFFLKPVVKYEDPDLDVAILELEETNGVPFPDALINFSKVSPNKKFTFIGHPLGNFKKQNEVDGPVYLDEGTYHRAVDWSMRISGSDGFVGVRMPGRLLFHCSFQQGGSGSPGIAIEGGKKAVVVTMLLRGYPEWYYHPNCNPQIHDQVARGQCIEQGVDMVELYLKMRRQNQDLCATIFGQND